MSRGNQRLSAVPRRSLRAAAVLTTLLITSSCTSDIVPDDSSSDAAVYRAVIAELAADFDLEPPAPDENAVLFIESFALDGIALEVQVDLIADFDDTYDVRFVDEREEAIDDDIEDRPVREGSAFVGLGPIVDQDPLTVRVEVYADERNIRAFRFTLTGSADERWDIVGTPEEVAPEGFVATS